MQMSGISPCNVKNCAYNMDNNCHTPVITVGPHAECNTFNQGSRKNGWKDVKGSVGACLASDCRFNEMLECVAPAIHVINHSEHADCKTFEARVSSWKQ